MENILRRRLAQGEFLLGSHINTCDSTLTEAMGQCGIDYLWIDTEHTAIDYQALQLHMIAARAARCPVMVRVPWNESYLAKRVLEMGPEGIVFPMIRSVEEAEQAISFCRYPPQGSRSFGPIRAADYGAIGCQDFAAQESPCCFLQVEHIDAVNRIDDILSLDGLDGIIFGPCDLSGSMHRLGRLEDEALNAAIDHVIARCREKKIPAGVSLGLAPAPALLKWKQRGLQFISCGNEYAFVQAGLRAMIQGLQTPAP